MFINGRKVQSRDELTPEEIESLPEAHPWKRGNLFSCWGADYTYENGNDEAVDEIERQRAEEDSRIRKAMILEHYRNEYESGVLPRYWNESLDTYKAQGPEETKNVAILKRFVNSRNRGGTVVICGENGTGKTLLGCALVREMGGRYMTATRLVYEVDSTLSFKAKQTKVELLDELAREPLLVIDEVGRGTRPEMQSELIYYLYNERYSRMLPTAFISNLSKEELGDFLGKATVDRLNETCIFLEFNGESYRPKKRMDAIEKSRSVS